MYSRTILLNVKVLQEHKDALRALAALDGETMSVILRRLIKEAAIKKEVWSDCELNYQKRDRFPQEEK